MENTNDCIFVFYIYQHEFDNNNNNMHWVFLDKTSVATRIAGLLHNITYDYS